MTVTGPAELLATWEAGLTRHGPARAQLLHRAARPQADDEALAALPLGAREADLFTLRRALFGERMEVRLECAACEEAMEFDLDVGQFAERFPEGPAAQAGVPGEPVRVVVDGWEIAFRPPTVADLAAAARAGRARTGGPGSGTFADEARGALLRRCVVAVVRDGAPLDIATAVQTLPETVRRALAEAAEGADPGADVTFGIGCPACGEVTRAELDIASYLWTELDAWARDVLLDVHLLACAYGWTEPQILALSPLRRRYYLELCADA